MSIGVERWRASRAAGGSRPANRPAAETASRAAAPTAPSPSAGRAPACARLGSAAHSSTGRRQARSNTRTTRSRSAGSSSLFVAGVDVDRQLLLDEQEMRGVLVGRDGAVRGQPQLLAQRRHRTSARRRSVRRRRHRSRGAISAVILPQRLAVVAPVERERPARQLLARIPFALPVVQQAARREALFAGGAPGPRR